MPLVTVADILPLLTPTGAAVVLGGAAGLDREVTWPVPARPTPPIFHTPKAGELALAAAATLQHLDPPPDLSALIAWLAEHQAAGLVLRGPLAPNAQAAAVAAAERYALPLLLVGDATVLPDLERAITTLLRERRDLFQERVAQLQEVQFHLAQTTPGDSGVGLATLVATLATLTGGSAALTGSPPTLALRYVRDALTAPPPSLQKKGAYEESRERPVPSSNAEHRTQNAEFAKRWPPLAAQVYASWQASDGWREVRASEPPVLLLRDELGSLLVAPVLVRDRPAAALLLAASEPPAVVDRMTLARAAGICALELARGQAVAVAETRTEQRLRGEFLTDLLHHPVGAADAPLRARAAALGLDLAPAYAVALLTLAPPGDSALSDDVQPGRLEAVAAMLPASAREVGALVGVVGGQLAALWPLREVGWADRPPDPPAGLLRLAEELRGELAQRGVPVAGGVGRVYGGLGGAARSRAEAADALWAAWQLFGGGCVCRWSDLGLYRLLLPLRAGHAADLRAFYEDTLGPLAAPIVAAGDAKLLDTLDAYLAHGGNSSATAAALYLHRNTLTYRLRRIRVVSGLDLDDPAVRLRVQVALAARRLL